MTSLRLVLMVFAVMGVAAEPGAQLSIQTGPCGAYDEALLLIRQNSVEDAINRLRVASTSCPEDRIKGSALLKLGEIALDLGSADSAFKYASDVDMYATTPAFVGAKILKGRIALSRPGDNNLGRNIVQAHREFDSAVREVEAIPGRLDAARASYHLAALYYRAEAARLAHQPAQEVAAYQEIINRNPEDPEWVPRALLGLARYYYGADQLAAAMNALQQVRTRFPKTTEAATALRWNTVLLRLHFRRSDQPFEHAATIGGDSGNLDEGRGLAVDQSGAVIAAYRGGWSKFQSANGEFLTVTPTHYPSDHRQEDVSALGVSKFVVAVARGDTVTLNGIRTDVLAGKEGRAPRKAQVIAIVPAWTGDWLVIDKATEATYVYRNNFRTWQLFRDGPAVTLAVNDADDIAVVNADNSIVVLDRIAGSIGTIPRAGQDYRLNKVAQVAFDSLGNLYVLDKEAKTIQIFGPRLNHLREYRLDVANPRVRTPVGLAVSSSGSLFVFDDDTRRVLMFR